MTSLPMLHGKREFVNELVGQGWVRVLSGLILLVTGVWVLYRIGRGWLALNDRREIGR